MGWLWPPSPEFDRLWGIYSRQYAALGYDADVGRRLIALLHQAIENLDSYNQVRLPDWSPSKLDFGDPSGDAVSGAAVRIDLTGRIREWLTRNSLY